MVLDLGPEVGRHLQIPRTPHRRAAGDLVAVEAEQEVVAGGAGVAAHAAAGGALARPPSEGEAVGVHVEGAVGQVLGVEPVAHLAVEARHFLHHREGPEGALILVAVVALDDDVALGVGIGAVLVELLHAAVGRGPGDPAALGGGLAPGHLVLLDLVPERLGHGEVVGLAQGRDRLTARAAGLTARAANVTACAANSTARAADVTARPGLPVISVAVVVTARGEREGPADEHTRPYTRPLGCQHGSTPQSSRGRLISQ